MVPCEQIVVDRVAKTQNVKRSESKGSFSTRGGKSTGLSSESTESNWAPNPVGQYSRLEWGGPLSSATTMTIQRTEDCVL
jgi:hypothetical protein